VALAAMLAGLAGSAPVHAATYTVTNTRNNGAGSLRTAITSANLVPGSTIRFVIPTTDTGYNAATGVFTISLTSLLPAITAAGTIVDATTQAANVGNTNAGVLGTGGVVGVDNLTLATVQRPEILLADGNGLAIGLDIQAANVVVRGFCIFGFGTGTNSDGSGDIRVGAGGAGALIEQNVLGSTPTSWADPGAANRSGGDHIRVISADNGTIRNNLIGFTPGKGIELNTGANGWLVEGNEFRRNGIGNANLDAIDIENASGSTTLRGNLMVQSEACGVESYQSSGGNIVVNNTIQGNGLGTGAGLENAGVRLYGTGSIVDRNILSGNAGPGVMVAATSSNNTITRNSIYSNGSATGQVGIDLLAATDDVNLGTAPYVTRNDAGDADTGGNGLVNFPILSAASSSAGQFTLTGFARPGSVVEVFVVAADPSGFGEAQTFVLTATEGSAQDTDAGTGTYTNPVNGLNQGTDTTNRFRFTIATPAGVGVGSVLTATARVGNATSEFSGNVTVTGGPAITLLKSVAPPGAVTPGTELGYSVVFTNGGGAAAFSVVLLEPMPGSCDFKLGSIVNQMGTTGLIPTVAYSNNNGSTWTYVPASGTGGAPAGFDRTVTHIRWTMAGTLGSTTPANQGTVGFVVRVR
jgi:parallel beta-helix repeat protein